MNEKDKKPNTNPGISPVLQKDNRDLFYGLSFNFLEDRPIDLRFPVEDFCTLTNHLSGRRSHGLKDYHFQTIRPVLEKFKEESVRLVSKEIKEMAKQTSARFMVTSLTFSYTWALTYRIEI